MITITVNLDLFTSKFHPRLLKSHYALSHSFVGFIVEEYSLIRKPISIDQESVRVSFSYTRRPSSLITTQVFKTSVLTCQRLVILTSIAKICWIILLFQSIVWIFSGMKEFNRIYCDASVCCFCGLFLKIPRQGSYYRSCIRRGVANLEYQINKFHGQVTLLMLVSGIHHFTWIE